MMMMTMIAYDVKEGGGEKRERPRDTIYLTLPRHAIEKETQDLVYIAIALFSSVHFKHICHIVSGWHSPRRSR